MIQNKLVWFQTKRAYNDAIDHGDIDDHSIVFVGDGTIYTHGTEFSTKKVNQRIDDMIDQVDQDLGEYRDKVKDLADALKDSERERYAALITDAQNRLNEAQALLQQYKARIAEAKQNETAQGRIEYEGQLYDYAEVLDIVSSTLTNLQRRMGLIGDDLDQFVGFLETGQTINELELSVLDYIREINMLTAQAKEKLDYINVNQAIRTVLLREMDAKNGIIHDYITTTWLEENLTHVVEAVMNSMEPSWHVLVSRVNANSTDVAQLRVISNEHESAITNLVTRSNTAADTIASLSVRVTDTEASIDSLAQVNTGLAESIAQVQQKADENSAQIALLSQYSGGGSDNTNIAGLITRVNALEAATALYALQQDLNGAISRIAALELHSDDSGSSFTLTAEAVDDVLNATHAAKIFGFANAQGSGITLSADVLNFESSTIRIPRANLDLGVIDGLSEEDREMLENFQEYLESLEDVDYISWADLRSNGITFANNNDDLISLNLTDGLIHRYGDDPQKSSFHLALDGSGHLGYDSEGNYAISWGPDGVLIPSQNTFPQGGGEGGDTRYYQQAFKVTNDDTQPSVPNANFPNGNDGWNKYAQNTTGKYVWMTTRLVKLLEGNQITVLETWQTPWLISGPQGNPGEDGEGIEFVFHVSNSNDPSTAPALNGAYGTSAFLESGYVPTGWTNHPTGVSEEYKYEWGACRTKDSEGVWSQFFGPFLWSHYGENGTDGDGVEYIYYLDRNGSMIGVNDPTSWNIQYPEAFQADEYTGPTGSKWEDDPQNTQSGEYQYVSVRKKHNGTWGAFSSPTVWTYHAVDGVVDGFTVDLTNENMPVGTDAQGNVSNYTNSTAVEVFHNGARYTDFTVAVGTITRSDGASVTGMTATVSGSTITFSITSAANFAAKNAFIPITVTLGNGTTRSLTATAFGIATGEAGSSIDLKTDVSVIRTDYYGTTRVPSTVAPYVSISSGNGTITTIYPNQTSDYTFKYLHHKTSGTYTTETTLTTNTISTIADADYLEIRLYYGGTKIDTEKIPYVKDGAPGVRGHDATTYNVSILDSTIIVGAPEASPRKVTGTVKFKITKTAVQQQNDEYTTVTEELTTKTPGTSGIWDSETFACSMNGKTNTSATYSNGEWSITLNENYANVPFGTIVVYSATNTPVASAGVPFVITGAKGEQGLQGDTQGLSGIVLRFRNGYSSQETYRCGSLNQEDGIWYKDVVLYNGAYYHPNSADITGTAPADSNGNTNTGWTRFNMVDDTYIDNLIANNAYINSLTTDQIQITNSSGKVVAGMTSGSKIPTSITGTSSQVNNSSGIRIFAGTVPSNGNIANCAFTVKETGEVKASGGKVEFDVDGSGKVANGNISWTSSGQVTINGQVIQVGGSNVIAEDQLADGTALTNWINSKMISVDPEDIAAYLEENGLDLDGYAKTSDLTAYQLKSSLVSDLTQAGYNLATMSNSISQLQGWSNDGSWLFTTFAQKSELTNYTTEGEAESIAQSKVQTFALSINGLLWTESALGSKITNTINNSYIESALKTTSIKNYLENTYVTSASLSSTLADYVETEDLETYATKNDAQSYVNTYAASVSNKLWTESALVSKISSTVDDSYVESALKTGATRTYLNGKYVSQETYSSLVSSLDSYATKSQALGYVDTWASEHAGELHSAADIGSMIDGKLTEEYVNSKLALASDYLDGHYVTKATLGSYYTKAQTNTEIASAISTQATTDEAKFTLKSEITGSGSNSIKSAIVGIVKAGKSSLELTADDIIVSGNTTVSGALQATNALINNLLVDELYAQDPNSAGRLMLINSNVLQFTTPNGIAIRLSSDGSGSVANGNLTWDANGNIHIKNFDIDTSSSTVGENAIILTSSAIMYDTFVTNRDLGGVNCLLLKQYSYPIENAYNSHSSEWNYHHIAGVIGSGPTIYNAIRLLRVLFQVYRYGKFVTGGTMELVPDFGSNYEDSTEGQAEAIGKWYGLTVLALARMIKDSNLIPSTSMFANTDQITLYDNRDGYSNVQPLTYNWEDIPSCIIDVYGQDGKPNNVDGQNRNLELRACAKAYAVTS